MESTFRNVILCGIALFLIPQFLGAQISIDQSNGTFLSIHRMNVDAPRPNSFSINPAITYGWRMDDNIQTQVYLDLNYRQMNTETSNFRAYTLMPGISVTKFLKFDEIGLEGTAAVASIISNYFLNSNGEKQRELDFFGSTWATFEVLASLLDFTLSNGIRIQPALGYHIQFSNAIGGNSLENDSEVWFFRGMTNLNGPLLYSGAHGIKARILINEQTSWPNNISFAPQVVADFSGSSPIYFINFPIILNF